jgi:hypothetical protein
LADGLGPCLSGSGETAAVVLTPYEGEIARPHTFDLWASKAVLGERVWANRKEVPVPERYRVAPHVLIGMTIDRYASVVSLTLITVAVLVPVVKRRIQRNPVPAKG